MTRVQYLTLAGVDSSRCLHSIVPIGLSLNAFLFDLNGGLIYFYKHMVLNLTTGRSDTELSRDHANVASITILVAIVS